jgi:hypothetical protein
VRLAAIAVSLVAFDTAAAQHDEHALSGRPVGTVHFKTSCSAAAQPVIDRAVALLHSFAFSQSTEAFNAVLGADGRCAMASWGIAMSAWGNPVAAGIKPPAQIQRGLDAVTRARAAGSRTPRESRYIEAVAKLYERSDAVPQGARLAAYRDAMGSLVAAYPADTEAAIFHALAMVAAADPTDKSYASQRAAGATLERLFARMPDHPGLAHYIIHSYDVPPLASKALGAANRYARIAPTISHALHMPSHTYTRLGLWEKSIVANVSAADAARREGATAEELHASDYRMYAYLQLAQDSAAARILGSLAAIAPRLNLSAVGTGGAPAAGYYALAAIPARYVLERGAWADAARLTVTPSPVPFADAVTWFARALGAARTGDVAATDSAITELQRLRDRLEGSGEAYWTEQVEIQRRAALAWRAFAAGQTAEALAEMRAAADREDATEKNAITPGPLAPARELLGDMLLAAREPAQALAAFEATLRHEPNRFRTIAQAARAATAAGNRTAARAHYAALLELGAHADRPLRPELAEAARAVRAN